MHVWKIVLHILNSFFIGSLFIFSQMSAFAIGAYRGVSGILLQDLASCCPAHLIHTGFLVQFDDV